MDVSARWYAEKLGLKVVMRTPKQDKAAAVALEGEGLISEPTSSSATTRAT
jgi:hypothetical protein